MRKRWYPQGYFGLDRDFIVITSRAVLQSWRVKSEYDTRQKHSHGSCIVESVGSSVLNKRELQSGYFCLFWVPQLNESAIHKHWSPALKLVFIMAKTCLNILFAVAINTQESRKGNLKKILFSWRWMKFSWMFIKRLYNTRPYLYTPVQLVIFTKGYMMNINKII